MILVLLEENVLFEAARFCLYDIFFPTHLKIQSLKLKNQLFLKVKGVEGLLGKCKTVSLMI